MQSKLICKCEKAFAMFLIIAVFVFSMSTQAAYANSSVSGSIGQPIVDLYAQGATEVVDIGGEEYTYQYYYNEDGNRAINIINSKGDIDVVTYSPATSRIYLNDEFIGSSNDLRSTISDDGYVYMGTDTQRVSWAKGTSVAVVAGAIAIVISGLGAAGVIAAIGAGSLSIIASNSIGGTVTVSLYTAHAGIYVLNKFEWTFTASSGDSYGPYLFVPPTGYSMGIVANS